MVRFAMVRTPQAPDAQTVFPVPPPLPGWARNESPVTDTAPTPRPRSRPADLSQGMLRRLMVLPFDRRFTDADRDPDLFEGIWANELPGVLNQALAGYKRVVERGGKFKRPSPVKGCHDAVAAARQPPAGLH
jgi:hypothetical protein